MTRMVGFLHRPVSIKNIVLNSKKEPGKTYRSKLYSIQNKDLKTRPTILLAHGMSKKGIDDPRITELALGLASSGYTVVTPEYHEVMHLEISEQTPENILDSFLALEDYSGELNLNKLGFFSVSFSGGMGLIALMDKKLSGKVKSAIVIGGFADFSSTAFYTVENYYRDDYGTFIYFYNYIQKEMNVSNTLVQLFYESALDNGLQREKENSISKNLYNKLENSEKEIYDNICKNEEYRKELVTRINLKLTELMKSTSPLYRIESLNVPLALIHGKDDAVIPESESIKLGEKLISTGKDCFLEITGLLSHGDRVPIWKQLKDVPGLARAFGYFFYRLEN